MIAGGATSQICDHCGLPMGGVRIFPSWARPETRYCCSGCRFAAAILRERGSGGQSSATLASLGISVFLTINVMMFTMVLWTNDVYGVGDAASLELAPPLENVLRHLCLVLALPVLWLLGVPLARDAWRGLRDGTPGVDMLLVAGVGAAFVYSVVSTIRGRGHVYFEVGCTVLVLVTLGRWFEATGRLQATQALDALTRLLPQSVRRMEPDGSSTMIALTHVAIGDRLRVLAGERIPVDGRVVSGAAWVDQQVITGESRPVEVAIGSMLFGGALNLDGDLLVQCSARPDRGTLQRLVASVERARLEKGHYQLLADRWARCFLPFVAAIAATALVWHSAASGLDAGLLSALAVVLIACPCALGLATPLAAWTALSSAARRGILFSSAAAIERLATIQAVAFDKTGTLTTGAAEVTVFVVDENADRNEVLTRAVALAEGSAHPLSQGIVRFSRLRSPLTFGLSVGAGSDPSSSTPAAVNVRTLPGRGVTGEFSDLWAPAFLGNVRLMEENGLEFGPVLAAALNQSVLAGDGLACIGWEGRVRGVIGLREELRPSTKDALARCRDLGLMCLVLTGDDERRGQALQTQLGVTVMAGLLPDAKVQSLLAARGEFGRVAMVGDGLNDAPALAAADAGIALASASDLSRQSADICLLGDDLVRVPEAFELAGRTVRVMRQNLFWAFAYNVLGMGLAAVGILNPIWAAAAMTVSSSLVIGNSLRLTGTTEGPGSNG
jgi:heavy metal translocating P-type ATPase